MIVVGILRVLLTTCPNNQKSAGGIDLHAEWSACINLLIKHQAFFASAGFRSKVFPKTDTYLTFSRVVPSSNDDSPGSGDQGLDDELLFEKMPEYQFEWDRHRVIVAMIISDFFLFMLRHFKANHLVQFMYLSALLSDANGVLVLLKFLNQDFGKIDFEMRLDA